eukprot:gene30570-11736_t
MLEYERYNRPEFEDADHKDRFDAAVQCGELRDERSAGLEGCASPARAGASAGVQGATARRQRYVAEREGAPQRASPRRACPLSPQTDASCVEHRETARGKRTETGAPRVAVSAVSCADAAIMGAAAPGLTPENRRCGAARRQQRQRARCCGGMMVSSANAFSQRHSGWAREPLTSAFAKRWRSNPYDAVN